MDAADVRLIWGDIDRGLRGYVNGCGGCGIDVGDIDRGLRERVNGCGGRGIDVGDIDLGVRWCVKGCGERVVDVASRRIRSGEAVNCSSVCQAVAS